MKSSSEIGSVALIITLLVLFTGIVGATVVAKKQNVFEKLVHSIKERKESRKEGYGVKRFSMAPAREYKLPYLSVSGEKIVNEFGGEIYLRGFQGLGHYPIPTEIYLGAVDKGIKPQTLDLVAEDLSTYTFTDYDVQEIKSTGANVARFWIQLHELEKTPYRYSEKSVQILEKNINMLGDEGIYSIIVLGKIAQNTNQTSTPYINRGINFWENTKEVQDRAVALWGVLAERLKDNPYVAGYDVINEPVAPSKAALNKFYANTISEIRKYDDKHIIILEVDNLHKVEYQLGGKYNDANLVASFHYYYPKDFTLPGGPKGMIEGLVYPGGTYCPSEGPNCKEITWDKTMLEELLEAGLRAEDLQGMPIYIGEFGASSLRDNAGALVWTADMFSLLNKYNLHYTYHNYRLRSDSGYYFIEKDDVATKLKNALGKLVAGDIKYTDLTTEQKDLLRTENSYYLRDGIKEIVTAGFKGEL